MQENASALSFAQRVKIAADKLDLITCKSPRSEKLKLFAEFQALHEEAAKDPENIITDEVMCSFGKALRMGVFSMFCALAASALNE